MRRSWIAALLALPLQARADLPDQSALEAALRERIAASCAGVTAAVDPDLTRAAQDFVRAAQAGRAPILGSSLLFYAALESIEPAPLSGLAVVAPPERADRAVGDLFSRQCRFNRTGVAAAVLDGDRAVVALVTAAHSTDLAHVPGFVEPGAAVQIDGVLGPGFSSPRLFVPRPGGAADEQPLEVGGGRFRGRATLMGRGAYTIEVLATGPGGPQVVAIRRVFAGIAPPDSPPIEKPRHDTGLGGVEHAIAQLRAAHGLPPLERDPALDAVAQSHSREMARTRVFAHVLATDGTVGDRLKRAGYPYRSVGENIGLSSDALGAHEAVAASPAHLANLLDPHHRRLGLGAARGASPEGAEAVYLTEVLAAPIVASGNPQEDVARVLLDKRRRLGLHPLQRDPRLDALAAAEVRELPGSDGHVSADFRKSLLDKARRARPELHVVAAETFVGNSADETSSSRALAEGNWTRLGVGAIYASSDTFGTSRLWVLLLYAR